MSWISFDRLRRGRSEELGVRGALAAATLVFVQEYAEGEGVHTQWKGVVTPQSEADGGSESHLIPHLILTSSFSDQFTTNGYTRRVLD